MEVPPPLVQVLGGNVVTAATVLACLNTVDATMLRRLHPALAAAVAAVPWADTNTFVRNTVRWRAALPAATALSLAAYALLPLPRGEGVAALGGVTVLNLTGCNCATNDVIARLPSTLRILNVSECKNATQDATFTHLPALERLDCSRTFVLAAGLARLPPSLRELHMNECKLPDTADFSHLCNLQVVVRTLVYHPLSATTAASLPPSLEVLDLGDDYLVAGWHVWPRGWSLAHLTRLRELNAMNTHIDGHAAAIPPRVEPWGLHEADIGSLICAPALPTHAQSLQHTHQQCRACYPAALARVARPIDAMPPSTPRYRSVNVSNCVPPPTGAAGAERELHRHRRRCSCQHAGRTGRVVHSLLPQRDVARQPEPPGGTASATKRRHGLPVLHHNWRMPRAWVFAPADGSLGLKSGLSAAQVAGAGALNGRRGTGSTFK
mgnify:CR=1 FL=1